MRAWPVILLGMLCSVATPHAQAASCERFHGPCTEEWNLGGDCSAGSRTGAGYTVVDLFAAWAYGAQWCTPQEGGREIATGSQFSSTDWAEHHNARTGRTETDFSARAGSLVIVSWHAYDGVPGQPCTIEQTGSVRVQGAPTSFPCVAGDPLPPPNLPWGFLLP